MPNTTIPKLDMCDLMCQELEEIAWKRELASRDALSRVFDETKEEALESLAYEILEAYEKKHDGKTHKWVPKLRKEIPKWMTWPMLMEWAQRFSVQCKLKMKK